MSTPEAVPPETPITDAETAEPSPWIPYGLAALVFALWLVVPIILSGINGYILPADRGTFGDSFGSVNALFTGLAFAGVIYTVLLQRRELQLQRLELKLTRQTMIEQRNEMAASSASQKEIAATQIKTAQIIKEQSDNQLLAASVEASNAALAILNARINTRREQSGTLATSIEQREALVDLFVGAGDRAQLVQDKRDLEDMRSYLKLLRSQRLRAENDLLAIMSAIRSKRGDSAPKRDDPEPTEPDQPAA